MLYKLSIISLIKIFIPKITILQYTCHFQPKTTCVLDWNELWHSMQSTKEATFMWSIWHNVIAVHSWRMKIVLDIDTNCSCCDLGVEKNPIHRFFSCPKAQDT